MLDERLRGPSVGQADADDVVLYDVVDDVGAADARVQPDAVARERGVHAVLKGEPVDDHVAGADARPLRIGHDRFRAPGEPGIDPGLRTQQGESLADR